MTSSESDFPDLWPYVYYIHTFLCVCKP
jgi:hypothetical protein